MATKVFLYVSPRSSSVIRADVKCRLGATGYIGGDALHQIAQTHPEYEITCLVRNSEKGALVASQFAKVRLVYGDLASEQILEEEAKKADVVIRT